MTVVVIPVSPAIVNVSPPFTVSAEPESAAMLNDVVIELLDTPVIRPCASTVMAGTTDEEPYVPAATAVLSRATVRV